MYQTSEFSFSLKSHWHQPQKLFISWAQVTSAVAAFRPALRFHSTSLLKISAASYSHHIDEGWWVGNLPFGFIRQSTEDMRLIIYANGRRCSTFLSHSNLVEIFRPFLFCIIAKQRRLWGREERGRSRRMVCAESLRAIFLLDTLTLPSTVKHFIGD